MIAETVHEQVACQHEHAAGNGGLDHPQSAAGGQYACGNQRDVFGDWEPQTTGEQHREDDRVAVGNGPGNRVVKHGGPGKAEERLLVGVAVQRLDVKEPHRQGTGLVFIVVAPQGALVNGDGAISGADLDRVLELVVVHGHREDL